MKTRITLIFLCALFITKTGFTQTINFPVCLNPYQCYECNVFKPSCFNSTWACPGMTVKTAYGTPDNLKESFGWTVRLEGSYDVVNGSKSEGFFVSYPFKSGFNYTIKIASTAEPDNRLPAVNPTKLYMQLTNSLVENNSAACNAMASRPAVTGDFTTPVQLNSGNTATFQDDTRNVSIPVGKNYSQLFLYSDNISSTGSGGIQIQYIDIIEHQPQFVPSPSSVSLNCGFPATQTFSILNPQGITGTLSYEWNLGSTPNGWLYNGSPAPAKITTTTNSISLSSVCQTAAPKPISVVVYKNGVNYNTYNIGVNFNTAPTLSINGPASACGTAPSVYTLSAIPCNSPVSWQVSPAGIVTSSVSGNNISLTPVGQGIITLSATYNTPCQSGVVVSKTIPVGVPPAVTITAVKVSGPDEPTDYQFTAPLISNVTYNWYVGGTLRESTPGGNTFLWYFPCLVSSTVYCTLTNGCGTSAPSNSITRTGGCRDDRAAASSFTVSPNPATSVVSITARGNTSAKSTGTGSAATFDQVVIYDFSGNPVKRQKYTGVRQGTLDVSNLRTGTYYIEIRNGRHAEKQTLIIQQ